MLSDRLWGQVTYAILATGLLSFAKDKYQETSLVFLIFLSVPLLLHTAIREHARIRLANYLRVVIEPQIDGFSWEAYLGWWRSRRGKTTGWLDRIDRVRHILALSGIYLVVSTFAWLLLLRTAATPLSSVCGSLGLAALAGVYAFFFHIFDSGAEEYRALLQKIRDGEAENVRLIFDGAIRPRAQASETRSP